MIEKKINFLVGIIGIFLTTLTTGAFAGGFANLDIGLQRTSMFACVAKAEDPTAMFHNPAGLAQQDSDQFYMSFTGAYVIARFRIRYEDGTLSEKIKPSKNAGAVPFIGFTSDFNTEKWVFGISWYFPNLYASALQESSPARYHGIEAYFINYYLTPTVAYKIADELMFGFGFSHLYALLYGRTMVKLKDFNPILPGDGEIEIKTKGYDWVWDCGFLWRIKERLRLGLSFSSRTWMKMKGDFEGKAIDFPIKITGDIETKMPIPESLRFGVNYKISNKWEIGSDLTWWNYKIYKQQVMTIEVDENPYIKEIPPIVNPKNYWDSWNVCIGAQYQKSSQTTLYFGIQHDNTPVPDETFSVDNPTSNLWGLGLGWYYLISPNWNIGTGYVINLYDRRDVRNSITKPPSNAKTFGLNQELVFAANYKW